jgi:hypothetical protein
MLLLTGQFHGVPTILFQSSRQRFQTGGQVFVARAAL